MKCPKCGNDVIRGIDDEDRPVFCDPYFECMNCDYIGKEVDFK